MKFVCKRHCLNISFNNGFNGVSFINIMDSNQHWSLKFKQMLFVKANFTS